jgi:hypothetical protein
MGNLVHRNFKLSVVYCYEAMKLKPDPLPVFAGLVMLSSIFLPWIRPTAWSLGIDGSLISLGGQSFIEMASFSTAEGFTSFRFWQLLAVLGCLIFILIGAGLVILQIRTGLIFMGGLFGVGGLLMFSLISLDFLSELSLGSLDLGYPLGWVGAIAAGIVGEQEEKGKKESEL